MQTDTIHYSLFIIHSLLIGASYEESPCRVGKTALYSDVLSP